MSRIHEALKKAEADRARTGAGNGSPADSALVREGAPGESSAVDLNVNIESAAHSNPDLSHSPSLAESPFASILESVRKSGAHEIGGGNGSAKDATQGASACSAAMLENCPQVEWTPVPGTMLSAKGSEYRIGTEEFRTLRSSLELTRKQRPLKTLLVTSPLPKEGKTFVAVNLAQALGWQREHKILLIDGDLRLARIHTCFGEMPREPGLVDYLSGDVDPISLIRRGGEGNLFVLPAGRTGSNSLELISNGRLKSLVQWLAPAFDWIVIDSPPAIPVSDARLIAEICDGVLFVVRAGNTPSDLAQRAVGLVSGKRYVGIVLNAVDSALTASSYYYGGNGSDTNRKGSS